MNGTFQRVAGLQLVTVSVRFYEKHGDTSTTAVAWNVTMTWGDMALLGSPSVGGSAW